MASPDSSPSSSNSSPPPPTSSPPPSPPPPDQSPPPASPPPPPSDQSPPPASPPPPPSDQSPPSESPPPPPSDQSPPSESPPPPPSDQSPPSASPPPPPPPSGNGDGNRSSNPPSPLPQSPDAPSQTINPGFSPPPKHHKWAAPPLPDPTLVSSNLPSSRGKGDQLTTAIIGIAAAAGVLLIIVIIIMILNSRRKKRSNVGPYYYDNYHADGYYKRAPYPNYQQQEVGGGFKNNHGEQSISVPPPMAKGQKPWVTPPSSPTPQVYSCEMSNFSSGPQGSPLPPPHPVVALGFHKSNFTMDELSAATGGFSQANLIGQGGFGYVHKGVFPNGKEIAVKTLKSVGGQGDKEFQAEIEVINRVHHRHLVSLVGYCISEGKSLLVYEFVPNKTLEYHLHGKGRLVMPWSTRLKIALGSAKGLAYLHEDCNPRIIHRDIKGANILIDDNFEAKVADFGLARFNQDNNTHVSTRVMGTFGYMAPEYASSGKLTEKSDVFSYGVMLLELITGRPPIDLTGDYEEDCLVEWARPLCTKALESGNYEGLVDPRLENSYEKQEMARMVACAAASVRHSGRKRPKMSQIVRALEGNISLDALNEGVRPGQSSIFSNNSCEYDSGAYKADMSRFRKLALESGIASSDYGGTSEFENDASISSQDMAERHN